MFMKTHSTFAGACPDFNRLVSQIQALDRTQPGLPLKKVHLGTFVGSATVVRAARDSVEHMPAFGSHRL
jgi:hypothetical protein